jgi:uncharacterized protein YqjF (DUF2071 family)
MEGIRPRRLPAAPWLSRFAELNLRTYVTVDGKPGVFFFSLDAGNPVAVALARRWFYLPYFRASMDCVPEGEAITYRSTRTHAGAPPARFEGRYQPAGDVFQARPGTLEYFLAERYCLYASPASVGREPGGVDDLYRADIHHAPWPLQTATAAIKENSLLASVGIDDDGARPAHLLFARSIDVHIWRLQRV